MFRKKVEITSITKKEIKTTSMIKTPKIRNILLILPVKLFRLINEVVST